MNSPPLLHCPGLVSVGTAGVWGQIVLCCGRFMCTFCRVLSSILGLSPLNAIALPPPPCCENQKYLQTMLNIPGTEPTSPTRLRTAVLEIRVSRSVLMGDRLLLL